VSPPKLSKIVNISPNDKITLNKIKIYIKNSKKNQKQANKQKNPRGGQIYYYFKKIIFIRKKFKKKNHFLFIKLKIFVFFLN
jgi:hypothetical protein